MPAHRPARNTLMVSWICASGAPRSWAISGRLGRYMSMDRGPKATSAASRTIRRWGLATTLDMGPPGGCRVKRTRPPEGGLGVRGLQAQQAERDGGEQGQHDDAQDVRGDERDNALGGFRQRHVAGGALDDEQVHS